MPSVVKKHSLDDLNEYVREAQEVASVWRAESWIDSEYFDGKQWSDADYNNAVEAGIDPLTINRIFPTVNLMLGMQILNKFNIGAKGRTKNDIDTADVVSQGIQFVADQWGAEFLVSKAYKDQIVPGIGFLMVCHSPDPRDEKIRIAYRDWKEMWWDPFADPWMEQRNCRYAFHQRWVDLRELSAQYPDRARELEERATEALTYPKHQSSYVWYDEAQQVEEMKRYYGGGSSTRVRVRPVEMWYPTYVEAVFARFADGRVFEVTDNTAPADLYQIILAAQEIVKANVKRMNVTVFLDDIVLFEGLTPYNHDEYPYVPLVGYLDRYNFPFGVPRQIREQNTEINRRRSMALTLLRTRRVIAESDVVENADQLQRLYEEANKPDGFLVVRPGKKQSLEIIEGTNLVAPQMDILRESEREIQQISGQNPESHGYRSDTVSGVAIKERIEQANIISAPLMQNFRRSLKRLGELLIAEMQGQWQAEKVLRITDRMTGADRFVELNKRLPGWNTATVGTKNDITQGRYDVIISEATPTDTVREQTMNILIEWAKKCPPEWVPHLVHAALEMSNLPNKEQIMSKIHVLAGFDPADEDLSPMQMKEKIVQELEAQREMQGRIAQYEEGVRQLSLEKLRLENEQLKATIQKLASEPQISMQKAATQAERARISGFKAGFDSQMKATEQKRASEKEAIDYQLRLAEESRAADESTSAVQADLATKRADLAHKAATVDLDIRAREADLATKMAENAIKIDARRKMAEEQQKQEKKQATGGKKK